MQVKLQDYPDMADQLATGGFDADQTAALVVFVGRLYSGQYDFIEGFRAEVREQFGAVRRETGEQFEKSRQESDQRFQGLEQKIERTERKIERTEEKIERADGKIERIWRTLIGMLASLVIAMIGAGLAFALRLLS